ncbi:MULTISPECIES: segregation/condensation protein A [Clostridium]|uniref:Segregation and condensation protein A n=1 Tax=Clostridium senegalense TaxID=1465809 RepID=A0A6M0H0G0_9CLOT|nr:MULTISPECIES: segregation/condensation protein A [Clostridium]NEU03604.1 segregation/condensation protein A [Clostridium senegalense]
MSLSIKITNFEGPFDLLLHLIKKNEMSIYDIKILEITNQYLGYLKTMQEMDLEITSEFIVIAATLIEIKSKLLLPKPKVEEYENEEDAAKELVEKLIQYKKYKMVAEFLGERQLETGAVFSKKPEIIEEKNPKKETIADLLKNRTMLDLYNLYNELMNNYLNKMNEKGDFFEDKIKIETFKIEDKMTEITTLMKTYPKIHFSRLIEGYKSKSEAIVTFLALLELIKIKTVNVIQEKSFSDIYVERVDDIERTDEDE